MRYTNSIQFINVRPFQAGLTPTQYKSKTGYTEQVVKQYPDRKAINTVYEVVRHTTSVNPNAPVSVRKLNRTRKLVRAEHIADNMPELFMRIAGRDNKRLQQRDERRAIRAEKKAQAIERRLTAQMANRIK